MRHTYYRRGLTIVAVATLIATLTGGASSRAMPEQNADCAAPAPGRARCLTTAAVGADGRPLTRAAAEAMELRPYTAADLQDAYNLPSALLGARQTVAVVAPYGNPKAEADLAVYRAENGLPPCGPDFPCLRKVNQRGGSASPPANVSWSLSSAGGLQMVSAACPNCQLLLVEADDDTVENLGLAVDRAVQLGADVVVAMYGVDEYEGMLADAVHYDHPGVPIVAPSGNAGIGLRQLVPASYSTVVAVGGTALFRDDSPRGWGETAWQRTGSGCSVYVARPAWQREGLCGAKRTVGDVAAVADANTPVAVYHTYGQAGWLAVGGTPVSAALVAGVYALAGNAGSIDPHRHLYRNGWRLFDVRSGGNGSCGGSYLCTATRGYDGPTGLGTPNGIGAF